MPKKKKNSKKEFIEETTKSTVKITKELVNKFPNIPSITLMHLAVAINLKYQIYITDNSDLLDNKDYFIKKYNIQLMQPYEFSSVDNGIII